jgi:hypothetical protein
MHATQLGGRGAGEGMSGAESTYAAAETDPAQDDVGVSRRDVDGGKRQRGLLAW